MRRNGEHAVLIEGFQHQHVVLPFILLIFLYALFVPGLVEARRHRTIGAMAPISHER